MKDSTAIVPNTLRCVPEFWLALFVIFVAGCHTPDVVVPTLDEIKAEQLPEQESWFARFDVLDGENPRLQIYADYIAKFAVEDSTYMTLEGHPDSLARRVVAYLFDEVGDSSATIHSDRMVYFEEKHRFEALGNVVVHTHDDKVLETEYLIWLEADRQIKTQGFVRINSPLERIQGYDLEADEDLENYEIARITGQRVMEDL